MTARVYRAGTGYRANGQPDSDTTDVHTGTTRGQRSETPWAAAYSAACCSTAASCRRCRRLLLLRRQLLTRLLLLL